MSIICVLFMHALFMHLIDMIVFLYCGS